MEPGPDEPAALGRRLRALVADGDRDLAGQLRLLVRFDELEGWRAEGAISCAAWMDARLGIEAWEARERLRVGRALRRLPTLSGLFDAGRLSWAKVRLLTRVAAPHDEAALARAALDAPAADVRAIAEAFRHGAAPSAHEEAAGAARAHRARSLRWHRLGEHAVRIVLELPRAEGAEWLRALERAEDALHERARRVDPGEVGAALAALYGDAPRDGPGGLSADPPDPAQRRADAALLMASESLRAAGPAIAASDRYRVLVNVDVEALSERPAARAFASGFGPLSPATARRLACDAGLGACAVDARGEALDVGRRTRVWPAAMRRAALARDRRCQVPGCGATRYLDVHHLVHWIDGGPTSLDNAACVCRRCHVMLHEGGHALVREAPHGPSPDAPREARVAHALASRVARFRLVRRAAPGSGAARQPPPGQVSDSR